MKNKSHLIALACAGFASHCAAVVPQELASARAAYQTASTGPAANVAPAQLHIAHEALGRAEQSFQQDPDSYRTRDLAYVAQRKAELAGAAASIAIEQQNEAQAKDDYQATQGEIVAKTKEDLGQTKSALAASEVTGKTTAGRLSVEQAARSAADKRAANAVEDRLDADQRTAEAQADTVAADKRTAEAQAGRLAAEQRAATAQAALARLAAIKDEPRGMVITLSGSVLFASNQAVLLPEARTRLDQVVDVLLATRERNVTIEGHTDSQGTDGHNLELSQRRADAVRNYLVQREYQADRIQAHGLGKGNPIADNGTAEGRANNRRVEIIIARP